MRMAALPAFLKRVLVCVCATVFFFTGCATIPDSSELPVQFKVPVSVWQPVQRQQALRALAPEDRARLCPDDDATLFPPLLREVKLIGSLTNYNSVAQAFIVAISNYLPYAVAFGDRENVERLRDYLIEAAESRAYLQRYGNDFGINGYAPDNEPAYVQALMLIPLSLAYDYLTQVYGRDDPGTIRIREWGDALVDAILGAGDRLQKGYDRWAAKAAGFGLWGAVSGNTKALRAGWGLFSFGQSVVAQDGRHVYADLYSGTQAIKYLIMAIGMQVLAAEAFAAAGFEDVYAWKSSDGKGSLHDTVHWLMLYSGTVPGSYLGSHYHSTLKGPAWAEFYLRRFPGTATNRLIEQTINRPTKHGIYTGYFGGWTTCLVHPLETASR